MKMELVDRYRKKGEENILIEVYETSFGYFIYDEIEEEEYDE